MPVYPQPGRGGGWSLVGGARTDLTGLTSAESTALLLFTGPAASDVPVVRSALRKVLQDGVVRRRKVVLAYADRGRRRTRREVAPWGLVDKDELWYLVAGTDAGQRTFRVERILEAQ